jgi:hypothetical protein
VRGSDHKQNLLPATRGVTTVVTRPMHGMAARIGNRPTRKALVVHGKGLKANIC